MNQNYQDQLRSLSRSINDELRLLSRTINDDKNKNDNKMNKHIATLLEGKSKTQVKNNSRNYCGWTKEEDAIIISNKNDKKTNKHIATLLEGKSESQVQYHSAALIEKGTLKTLCLWTEEEDAIIISNKNEKKTIKHIATLLEGKSVSQIKYRSAALIEKGTLKTLCLWTEEEDAIIISNKNDKKTNKHIATLLEGKSESQINYRSRFLINKGTLKTGTLKTVAKLCLWTKEEDAIIISNKNDKKTNKHIATLLEGKSESQVRNHYYFLIDKGVLDKKGSMWTKEDDAIIISNKNDKKTNKHIATLLEGKSESQINYRSAALIEKGTLKMVAKKKKAPVIKTRIAPKASKYRFTMKRKIDDSCNDSLEQKYKPKSNKKHKSLNEPEDSLSDIDSSDNESSDDSSSDAEAEDWFIFSKALDTKQPDDVVSENIPTKPRNNIWMGNQNVKVKVEESVEVVEVVEETMTNISDCQPDDVVSENIPTKPRNNIWMNVKVKVEESVEVVEVVEETMKNISDCQPDDVVSENIPTKPRNNIWMNVKVKVEESVEVVEVVEETMKNISDCQPDDVVSENIPTKPRNNIWMNKMNGNVKVKVEETVGGTMKENL